MHACASSPNEINAASRANPPGRRPACAPRSLRAIAQGDLPPEIGFGRFAGWGLPLHFQCPSAERLVHKAARSRSPRLLRPVDGAPVSTPRLRPTALYPTCRAPTPRNGASDGTSDTALYVRRLAHVKPSGLFHHLVGVGVSTLGMLGIQIVAFILAISTFHNGPASDFSYSAFHVFLSQAGYVVLQAFWWPLHLFHSSVAVWFLTPFIYGLVLYALFVAIRRKVA
jgi:hypothetical protein